MSRTLPLAPRSRPWRRLSLWSGLVLLGSLLACGKMKKIHGGDGDGDEPSDHSSSSVDTDITEGDSSDSPDGCRRVVNLEGVTLGTPPAFDVVIVADNSESLSWSREDLAAGLSDLVANVHGHAVRFHVLSPTQYGQSSSAAIDLQTGESLVRWSDPVSHEPFTAAVTNYVQTCVDDQGQNMVCPGLPLPNLEFELEGRWEFSMPEPVAELNSEMSTEQLDAERKKVVDAILALGISGSTDEQPLCTLTRYLDQAQVRLPERAVFLVIADEDDTNSAESCLGAYEFSQYSTLSSVRDYSCTNDCDAYTFQMSRVASRNTLAFFCAPTDDLGELLPADTWSAETVSLPVTDSCKGVTSVVCNADDLDKASDRCTSGDVVQDCVKTCTEGAVQEPCGLTVFESTDLCSTGFTVGDVRYDNFADFCERTSDKSGWSGCSSIGFTTHAAGTTFSHHGVVRAAVNANSAQDLVHLFHSEAERAFGPDNYFVETIVFTPGGPCAPAQGQSYATELMNIASSPEQVYAICESYAPALSHVNDFARGLLETEYALELESRESIESITVHGRDATERQLAPQDYEYDPEAAVLHINEEALRSADIELSVEVVDPCAPIIR